MHREDGAVQFSTTLSTLHWRSIDILVKLFRSQLEFIFSCFSTCLLFFSNLTTVSYSACRSSLPIARGYLAWKIFYQGSRLHRSGPLGQMSDRCWLSIQGFFFVPGRGLRRRAITSDGVKSDRLQQYGKATDVGAVS